MPRSPSTPPRNRKTARSGGAKATSPQKTISSRAVARVVTENEDGELEVREATSKYDKCAFLMEVGFGTRSDATGSCHTAPASKS